MESLAGRLLVATPLLIDPNFFRSVVLLIEHDAEHGAFGLVLNRPSPVPIGEILDDWHDAATEPQVVFVGGPVQREIAVGLAITNDPGHRLVIGDVAMIDLGSTPAEQGDAQRVRVFSGYAGWDADQLEAEIEEGAWFVVDGMPGDATTDRPEDLWRHVLRRQHSKLAFYADYPDDPHDN